MVELAAKSPLEGCLPPAAGGVTLAEIPTENITAIMPHRGREKALATALGKAHGLELPDVGRSNGSDSLRLLWAGRRAYFLIGDKPASNSLARAASLVDQSDGWCRMALRGEDAAKVLARLCPLDLRPQSFKTGDTARSELRHMMALYLRGRNGFEIMVMRSFARTAHAAIAEAIKSVAAQNPRL